MATERCAKRAPSVARALLVLTLLLSASPRAAEGPAREATFLGKAARQWLAELKEEREDARHKDLRKLSVRAALVKGGKDAVPVLAEALATSDDEELVRIAEAIGEAAVPALCAALVDRKPEFRFLVMEALFRMRGKARAAVPALIESLGDTQSYVESNV